MPSNLGSPLPCVAGRLDVAVLASAPPFRAPDTEAPALALETLSERDLCVAVAQLPHHRPDAVRHVVDALRAVATGTHVS